MSDKSGLFSSPVRVSRGSIGLQEVCPVGLESQRGADAGSRAIFLPAVSILNQEEDGKEPFLSSSLFVFFIAFVCLFGMGPTHHSACDMEARERFVGAGSQKDPFPKCFRSCGLQPSWRGVCKLGEHDDGLC